MTAHGKALVAALILAAGTCGSAAATLKEIRELYDQEKYAEVIPLLFEYRNQPDGRTWQVDFMIGAAWCRLQDQKANGVGALNMVLNYPLSDGVRQEVEKELRACEGDRAPASGNMGLQFVSVAPQANSGPLVTGKGGFEIERTETVQAKVEVVPVALADLEKRVFPPDRVKEAVAAAKARLTDGWATSARGFVIAGDKKLVFPAEEIGDCLSRYRAPLEAEFDLRLPRDLVTVYVAQDPAAVKRFAGALHGVSLPMGTVAYSVYEDRSIVGMAAAGACGSLAHELVHIAIRGNFGNSPVWLQEGLASEVAVAWPDATRLRLAASWRDNALKRHWDQRPTVARLLQADWASLIARDKADSDRVVALQAMAAVFIRYLDARGKLVPVYRGVRDEPWSPATGPGREDAAIVGEHMGMSLDAIDADFVTWFGYKPPLPGPPPPPSDKGR